MEIVNPQALPKEFAVKVCSQEHYEAVVERVFDMGYSHRGETAQQFYEKDTFDAEGIRYVVVEDNRVYTYADGTGRYSGDRWDKLPALTLDDLFTIFQKVRRLELNGEYTATIEDGFIKVGCQEISFDKVKQLYDLIKEAEN